MTKFRRLSDIQRQLWSRSVCSQSCGVYRGRRRLSSVCASGYENCGSVESCEMSGSGLIVSGSGLVVSEWV